MSEIQSVSKIARGRLGPSRVRIPPPPPPPRNPFVQGRFLGCLGLDDHSLLLSVLSTLTAGLAEGSRGRCGCSREQLIGSARGEHHHDERGGHFAARELCLEGTARVGEASTTYLQSRAIEFTTLRGTGLLLRSPGNWRSLASNGLGTARLTRVDQTGSGGVFVTIPDNERAAFMAIPQLERTRVEPRPSACMPRRYAALPSPCQVHVWARPTRSGAVTRRAPGSAASAPPSASRRTGRAGPLRQFGPRPSSAPCGRRGARSEARASPRPSSSPRARAPP
jgi:hypothetical protein